MACCALYTNPLFLAVLGCVRQHVPEPKTRISASCVGMFDANVPAPHPWVPFPSPMLGCMRQRLLEPEVENSTTRIGMFEADMLKATLLMLMTSFMSSTPCLRGNESLI